METLKKNYVSDSEAEPGNFIAILIAAIRRVAPSRRYKIA
jgi:hypothetical protein